MDSVGSRELAQEVARCLGGEADDFADYMPTVQHWIRAGAFAAAGAGPVKANPRRGKSRRFPIEAIKWARLFAALSQRGAGIVEILGVAGVLHQRHPDALADALAGTGEDIWAVYATGDTSPPIEFHLQRGGVQLPYNQAPLTTVVTAMNVSRTFNR
jgi:hypothetical protein